MSFLKKNIFEYLISHSFIAFTDDLKMISAERHRSHKFYRSHRLLLIRSCPIIQNIARDRISRDRDQHRTITSPVV